MHRSTRVSPCPRVLLPRNILPPDPNLLVMTVFARRGSLPEWHNTLLCTSHHHNEHHDAWESIANLVRRWSHCNGDGANAGGYSHAYVHAYVLVSSIGPQDTTSAFHSLPQPSTSLHAPFFEASIPLSQDGPALKGRQRWGIAGRFGAAARKKLSITFRHERGKERIIII